MYNFLIWIALFIDFFILSRAAIHKYLRAFYFYMMRSYKCLYVHTAQFVIYMRSVQAIGAH